MIVPAEKEFRNPVLVLGGYLRGLWAARILGKRGIDVYMVANKSNLALFSRYCKGAFLVNRPLTSQEVLRKILRELSGKLGERPVVYPITDLDALNLSEMKDDLADDYYFVVGDKEPVDTIVNKSKFYKALDRNRITYPITYFPENRDDVGQVETKMTYPVFIRPAITELFMQTFGYGKKGFVAHSPKELEYYYRLATKNGIQVMFQEIIPGPPSNSYQLEGYYDSNHRPVCLFARQRLRIWPLDFGNTTLCVSVPLSELAREKEMVNKFIKNIQYTGLMSVEFKKDDRDGTLKLLEINGRLWLHFWLATECGVDIIFCSYLDAIGKKTGYSQEYLTDVKSVYFQNDLKASAEMLLRGELGFSEWVSSLQGKTRFTTFERGDLFPFVLNYADLTRSSIRFAKSLCASMFDSGIERLR